MGCKRTYSRRSACRKSCPPCNEHFWRPSLTLTAKDVAEILRVLEESTFDSLSLEMDGVKLHLQRGSAVPARQIADPGPAPVSAPPSGLGRTTKSKPPF